MHKLIRWTLAQIFHALAQGFALMLVVGIVHSEWMPHLHTLGYWWAVLIVLLITGILESPSVYLKLIDIEEETKVKAFRL